jgi:hypothetical protein
MRELELLQRVERDVAAVDVAEAQTRETTALETAERDTARAGSLAMTWDAAIGSNRFLPELITAIGAALLDADATADAATRQAKDMTTLREARTSHWQRLDATMRATGDVVRGLARTAARQNEETALAAVAEHATREWRRR